MAKPRIPITRAIRFLRSKQIDFNTFMYTYADPGPEDDFY